MTASHWLIWFDPEYASPVHIECSCSLGEDHGFDRHGVQPTLPEQRRLSGEE